MRLFKFLFATFILFATFNNTNGQVSSENLVGIHNLNTTQISGLVSPIKGSLVFNTDSNRLFVFDGAIWVATATVDTTSLSNRINQRVRYTDTASMLSPYLRSTLGVKYTDTATMLINYINSASNGLNQSGKTVRLGGNLTAATTITNNSNTLTIATGGSALNVTGLTAGAATDSLLTINTTTGRVNRVAPSLLNKVDSTTASNGITLTGKDVRLGGALTTSTTITTDATNTLLLAGLQSSSLNDSVVMITSGNVLRRINSSSIALEPFNVLGGTTKASTNTQNIFTQGDLSVGKSTSTATLDVGGKIKADSTISAPNFASVYQSLSSGATVTWNMQSGATAAVTLGTNATLSISNVSQGMYGLIRITQDATGGRTITLPSGSRVINGGSGAVTLTQTANAVDILTFFYDGTNYWWTIGNNYN